MAKPIKRNREPKKTLNLVSVEEGLYFDEVTYGEIFPLKEEEASVGGKEFVYEGKIRRGQCAFIGGKDLKDRFPTMEGFNHGFTLEGVAKNIFDVKNSLNIYSEAEKRTFCYTNHNSQLYFVGDPEKVYRFYIRFYDKVNDGTNERWAVLYAEEK